MVLFTTPFCFGGEVVLTGIIVNDGGISTCSELQAMENDLSADYFLEKDIDCSMTNPDDEDFDEDGPWGDGKGFRPIGACAGAIWGGGILLESYINLSFKGTFDGKNKAIKGLYINRPKEKVGKPSFWRLPKVGLFGCVDGAKIKNVILEDISISGHSHIGGLIGKSTGSLVVDGCSTAGSIIGSNHKVGGLIGTVYREPEEGGAGVEIKNSFSEAVIKAEFQGKYIGGLIGSLNVAMGLTIDNCHATGNVKGNHYVGGLIGRVIFKGAIEPPLDDSISDCYATGNVEGSRFVGGLIGQCWQSTDTDKVSTINNCHATGDVSTEGKASTSYEIGGLIGGALRFMSGTIIIENCYFSGNINTTAGKVGGVIGWALGNVAIDNVYSENGSVKGEKYVGGVIGWVDQEVSVSNAYAINEEVSGEKIVGGVMGLGYFEYPDPKKSLDDAPPINNVWSKNVTVTGTEGAEKIGGIIGENILCFIKGAYSENITVTGKRCVGGISGKNSGSIEKAYSRNGTIKGEKYVGGLAGANYTNNNINEKYTGSADYTRPCIRNAYSNNSVEGDFRVGGLVGENYSEITNSYSVGLVAGNAAVGGLVGENVIEGEITSSYWDTIASGQAEKGIGSKNEGEGKTTVEMVQESTFANWDFEDIWEIDEGIAYPHFK